MGGLERVNILLVILSYQLWQNRCSGQQISCFYAKHVVATGPSRATVSIDEGMNVIQPPENKGCERNSIGLFPIAINDIDKIIHQRRNAIVFRRLMLSGGNYAWPVFTSMNMETANSVKIESFDDLLGEKRSSQGQRCQDNRLQKIVVPIAVRDF